MKLEVGMYIRTNYGKIDKILKLNESYVKGVSQKDEFYAYDIEKIVKASYNIIDILEIGDYVNGYYVEDVLKTFVNVAVGINYFQSPTIYEKDIKSIVTKEQFESMKYSLEG